jgi:hypothetical protein
VWRGGWGGCCFVGCCKVGNIEGLGEVVEWNVELLSRDGRWWYTGLCRCGDKHGCIIRNCIGGVQDLLRIKQWGSMPR